VRCAAVGRGIVLGLFPFEGVVGLRVCRLSHHHSFTNLSVSSLVFCAVEHLGYCLSLFLVSWDLRLGCRFVLRGFAMLRSSSAPASSSSGTSYSSSLSITSFVQYGFLAALAYILAGAPLSSLLTSNAGGDAVSSSNAGARGGGDVKANLENLVIPERNLSCAAHTYKGVYVLSREPLVVYIEGFVGEDEGKEVVALRYVYCCFNHSDEEGATMFS